MWQALKTSPSSLQLPVTKSALKPLMRAGVPTELRPVVWFCVSGAAAAAAAAPANHYASLWATPLPKDIAFAIAEDTAPHALPLPSHRLLRSAAGAAALRRLLTALASSGCGSGSIGGIAATAGSGGYGYWRGLHCIAAFVLVVFGLEREEQAFWVTAALVQERLFGYCDGQGALGAAVEPRVLEALVAKKLPRGHEHRSVTLEGSRAAVTGGWFATMFTDVLPPEVSGRGRWLGAACLLRSTSVCCAMDQAKRQVKGALYGACTSYALLHTATWHQQRGLQLRSLLHLPLATPHLATYPSNTGLTPCPSSLLPQTVARIFDATMLEGSKVLLRVALATLTRYGPCITSCSSALQLRKVLSTRLNRLYDGQGLMACAFGGVGAMPGARIAGLRKRALLEVEEEAAAKQRALGTLLVRHKL